MQEDLIYLPYSGLPQFIGPINLGFNGAVQQTKYNRKVALGLGITQMIIGISCLIMNSVLIAPNPFINLIACGIWGGMLFFVAGFLQVLSAKKEAENRCLIIGTMVMAILTACACAVIIGFSVDESVFGDRLGKYDGINYNKYNGYYNNTLITTYVALETAMVILAFVEALIAIVTSAICFGAVCCKSSSMASTQRHLGVQPLPYSGTPQFIQPSLNYPGFNGTLQITRYNCMAVKGLGITQMIIGIICLILNIFLIFLRMADVGSLVAYGIWGGILIFVDGLLQVLSAKKAENRCLILGTMVMIIVSACASTVIIDFSVDAVANGDRMGTYSYGRENNAIGIIMIIVAFVEAVIAIVTSATSCFPVCCKSSSPQITMA